MTYMNQSVYQNTGRLDSASLLIVGDVMLDRYWFGEVERISPEAPVPVVRVQTTEERPGGAANVARNITALGAQATLLSVVGRDEAGETLLRLIKEAGIKAEMQVDPAIRTTVKLRVLGRKQQLLRIDFEHTPSHEILQAKLADFKSLVGTVDSVVLSDYGKGGLTHIREMILMAREAGKLVLVDPKGDDYERYRGATAITPNRSELMQVVGRWRDEADLLQRVQNLCRHLALEAVLLTRSEEGMTLFMASGEVVHHRARAQEVFDVSGAGDTVIATLASMLASGSSWSDAVHASNVAAGVVVGKLGTAVCHRNELEAALNAGL